MDIYTLIALYDWNFEVIGSFATLADAQTRAKQLEAANEVDIGQWFIYRAVLGSFTIDPVTV